MQHLSHQLRPAFFQGSVAICLLLATGCHSVISMRDALREGVETAAAMTQLATLGDLEPHAADRGPGDIAEYEGDGSDTEADPTAADLADSLNEDPAAVAAAIEAAISDLADADALDTASKAALIETLQVTPQADWPVVIHEFTATLAVLREADDSDAAPATKPPAIAPVAAVAVASPAEPAADEPEVAAVVRSPSGQPLETSVPSEPVPQTDDALTGVNPPPPAGEAAQPTALPPEDVTEASLAPPESAAASLDTGESAAPKAAVSAPTPAVPRNQLTIKHPSLARQVRGWGLVDPIEPADLRPGAEVIAYFELTGISSQPTEKGVTTSIDTTLRLEDERGSRLHTWSFPPLTETCSSPRRDYFARYVLDLPGDLSAGRHRLVLAVTDLQAGCTAETSIPLPVAAATVD